MDSKSTRVRHKERKKFLVEAFIADASARCYQRFRTVPGAVAVKRVLDNGFYLTVSPSIELRRGIYSFNMFGGIGHHIYDEIMSRTREDRRHIVGARMTACIGLESRGRLCSYLWGVDDHEGQAEKLADSFEQYFTSFESWSYENCDWRLILNLEVNSRMEAFSRYSVPILAKILNDFEIAKSWFQQLENSGWRDFYWDEYVRFFEALEALEFHTLKHKEFLPHRSI